MKKNFTLIFLILFSLTSAAQGNADITAILQRCINIPDVQEHMSGTNEIYVLQHGVSFPSNTKITAGSGKSVMFINKDQLNDTNVTSYLLFWEFKVESSSASIDFTLNYTDASGKRNDRHYVVTMARSGESWNVSNIKTEER